MCVCVCVCVCVCERVRVCDKKSPVCLSLLYFTIGKNKASLILYIYRTFHSNLPLSILPFPSSFLPPLPPLLFFLSSPSSFSPYFPSLLIFLPSSLITCNNNNHVSSPCINQTLIIAPLKIFDGKDERRKQSLNSLLIVLLLMFI